MMMGDIYRAMRDVAALGPPAILCFHCENWEIARVLQEEVIAQGRTDVGAWDERSPAFCEAGHVHDYSYYAKVTGCPIYIMHCTTRETLEEIMKAKAEGVNITGQATPHYMTVTRDKGMDINVPLRSGEDFEKLWEALRTGVLDCLGTDSVWRESPRSAEDVDKYGIPHGFDIWAPGQPHFNGSLGFMLPVMLSEGVNKGRISLERLVQVGCENTAKKFGLFPKKGTISIGSDADFVIVDLSKTRTVTHDLVISRQGWSIYDGWELKGWPVMTILRGNVLMEWPEGEPQWKIVGKPTGQYIPRKLGHTLYPLD